MTTTTLADVAGTSLAAVRILETHGLDYCCGGKRPFEEACIAKNLNPASVLHEIETENGKHRPDRDWQTAPLHELARYIVATHHTYLRAELPGLAKRLARVYEVHGPKDPETLGRMVDVFDALQKELEMHMLKEENILFPFVERYGVAVEQGCRLPLAPFGSIANPIAAMEREHTDAGDALGQLRRLTDNYRLPSYACTTVRNLYAGLQALELDLHTHIHLENNILFPRAVELEKGWK